MWIIVKIIMIIKIDKKYIQSFYNYFYCFDFIHINYLNINYIINLLI